MNGVTIALAKGRLGEKGLDLFKDTDMEIIREKDTRKLVFKDYKESITYIFVKPSDVMTYVEKGVADLGIVGKDMILEEDKDIYELMDLNYGKCRFAIAGFKDQTTVKEDDVLRIASKYPNYVKRVFEDRGQKVEIIKLGGSIELAPIIGLSDIIVDLVETGSTLKENGLVILEELDPISARLVANKASYRIKYDTIKKIEKILGGAK
ncbi:ATP phosphoribosyltransferase [Tissierella creatinini]|nr:ATP phosphoribosyltransferase [Tissierella creatinini]TJX66748.1 ATP phosphoribosyltransferase [Soehngenia saccharolytica]